MKKPSRAIPPSPGIAVSPTGRTALQTSSKEPRLSAFSQLWYRPRDSVFRLWIFNIHLYAGLALGIVTTIVGLSGSVVVYKPEIERIEAGSITKIAPGHEPRPLAELYALAQTAGWTTERLFTWGGPSAAWAFRTHDGQGFREYIYVDQYRGQVLGRGPMDGTKLQWIYDLHDNLLMGKRGLIVNGVCALLLVLMCLTGVVVWWPGAKRVREGFQYHWGANWQGQIYDLHKVGGIVVMLLLALIAVTGASYSFPDAYRKIFGAGPARLPQSHFAPGVKAAPLDSVLRAATEAVPQAELTVLTWPTDARAPFTVRKRLPGDWSRLGNQYVYLDQYTAQVLHVDLTSRMPLGNRLMQSMAPLHYGSFGGHWTRALWIVMGIFPGLLAITGFLMWWNRVIS